MTYTAHGTLTSTANNCIITTGTSTNWTTANYYPYITTDNHTISSGGTITVPGGQGYFLRSDGDWRIDDKEIVKSTTCYWIKEIKTDKMLMAVKETYYKNGKERVRWIVKDEDGKDDVICEREEGLSPEEYEIVEEICPPTTKW
jgi:hypothetical protein